MEQLASQRVLLDQQQQTIAEQRAFIEQQHTLIRSLQQQGLTPLSAPCAELSVLSLHRTTELCSGDLLAELKTGSESTRTAPGKTRGGRLCGGCGLVVPKKCFSLNQLTKLVNDGTGRCRTCVERGATTTAAPACAPEQSLSPAAVRLAPSPSSPLDYFSTISPSICPPRAVSSSFHPAISPSPCLPRALTLSVRDQPCMFLSESLLTPQLPPVPSSCFPLSSPEHSYTSLQTNLSCARGGVSTEEPKAGDADADTCGP